MTKYTNKIISPELKSIFQNNDFILMTETWADEFSDLSVDGFKLISLNRTERKLSAKRNSGGIALYIRDSFHKYCTLLEKSGDDIICIKIDKQIFNLSNDLYVCLCYIIPSGSSREAFVDSDVLDRLSDFIIKTANVTNDSYNLLICGDLNSRIGSEQDFVAFDNSLAKIIQLFYSFTAAFKASQKLRKSRRYWHLRISCRKASFSAELQKSQL